MNSEQCQCQKYSSNANDDNPPMNLSKMILKQNYINSILFGLQDFLGYLRRGGGRIVNLTIFVLTHP